jgi:hypothetical protein
MANTKIVGWTLVEDVGGGQLQVGCSATLNLFLIMYARVAARGVNILRATASRPAIALTQSGTRTISSSSSKRG